LVIWWLGNSPRLSRQSRQRIAESHCVISAVSLIEIRMKIAAGKLAPPSGASAAQQLSSEGFSMLPLTAEHVEESARFERVHNDAFDRLLLGTAAVENITLLTRDAALLALAKKAKLAWVMEG
jgi:PIN domain nuclease of toxin-antitoxin system